MGASARPAPQAKAAKPASRDAEATRLRILANHSCLTAAQHPHYNVLERGRIVDRWQIQRGW